MADSEKAPWYLVAAEMLLGVPAILFAGYVLARYWSWFVVDPANHRDYVVPEISYAEATGLLLLVGFVRGAHATISDGFKENQATAGLSGLDKTQANLMFTGLKLVFLYPLGLVFGWLWHKILY